MARMVQLLSCQKSTAVLTPGSVGTQTEGASGGPQEVDIDELVMVRENVCLGLFQTEIIEGWVKPLLGDTAHVMVTPLKVGEGQLRDSRPLLSGLHVLHMYTHLKNGSSKVSLMVRNMSHSHIFLKKGVPVVRAMSASPVPPAELSPEMEAVLGAEARPETMSVVVRQEKLLEKLNLDGLAHWSPGNAAVVRELVLTYHDVFTLEGNELGCTSAIEHKIHIENSKPFKERFQHIPPPLRFIQANHHVARQWSWSGRRMVLCTSVSILDASTCGRRRIPSFRRHWKAWWGQHTSRRWILSQASGRSGWHRSHSNTQPAQ